MSRVIAFTGYANVGKDEAAKPLVEKLNYERIALADPLKELALKLNPRIQATTTTWSYLADLVRAFGWEETKELYPESREFLVRLGNGMKEQFNDQYFWVDRAIKKMNSYHNVVITDVRYKPEARYLRTTVPGVNIIRIIRPGVGPANAHEREVDDIPIQGYIDNDGTVEDLHQKVLDLALAAERGQMQFEWDVT